MVAAGPSLVRLTVVLVLLSLVGCNRGPAPSSPGPAQEKPHAEGDLSRTTLSTKDVNSLGVQTAPLRRATVRHYLTLPGWIAIKQGNEVTLTAPVAGYVRAPSNKNGDLPVA